jgi:hypothetical protein
MRREMPLANTPFEILARHYHREAETCLDIAERLSGARRVELIKAAAQWIELAREAEAHRRPN